MAQKMQISDFLVKKCKSSLNFYRFLGKKLGLVLYSWRGLVTTNIHVFGLRHVTDKFIIKLK